MPINFFLPPSCSLDEPWELWVTQDPPPAQEGGGRTCYASSSMFLVAWLQDAVGCLPLPYIPGAPEFRAWVFPVLLPSFSPMANFGPAHYAWVSELSFRVLYPTADTSVACPVSPLSKAATHSFRGWFVGFQSLSTSLMALGFSLGAHVDIAVETLD